MERRRALVVAASSTFLAASGTIAMAMQGDSGVLGFGGRSLIHAATTAGSGVSEVVDKVVVTVGGADGSAPTEPAPRAPAATGSAGADQAAQTDVTGDSADAPVASAGTSAPDPAVPPPTTQPPGSTTRSTPTTAAPPPTTQPSSTSTTIPPPPPDCREPEWDPEHQFWHCSND